MTANATVGLCPLVLLTMTLLGQQWATAGEPASPPAQQASPPKEEAPRTHQLSTQVREAVSLSLPKFTPPKPEPPNLPEPPPDEDVLILPRIQVTPGKSPFDPFALLSHKTRSELARKQNPGLGLGSLFRLNEDLGVEILTQEREYAKRSTLKDEVDHLAKLDPAGLAEATKLLRSATVQPNRDWATSTGQSRNPNAVTIRPPPYPDKKPR